MLRYKLPGQEENLKKSTNEVKEYRKDGVTYFKRLVRGEAKPFFLQRIIKGKLNVFFDSYPAGYVNIDSYYGAIESDTVVTYIKSDKLGTGSEKFKKMNFFELISDSPEIVEMFEAENSYSLKTIFRTIRNYNLFNLDDVFYVNNKNDTTRCKIIFSKAGNMLYRKQFAKSFEPLNRDSLKVYKLNGTLYYKQQLPGKDQPQFIAHIIKGPINLYADLDDNAYVSKAGSALIRIKGEQKGDNRKDVLLDLLSDKPDLMQEFDKKKYNITNLLRVIRDYNLVVSKL